MNSRYEIWSELFIKIVVAQPTINLLRQVGINRLRIFLCRNLRFKLRKTYSLLWMNCLKNRLSNYSNKYVSPTLKSF